MNVHEKKSLRRLIGATAVYAVLVLVAGSAGRSLGPGLAGAAAVLSVLPAVYALVVVMRHVASLDELQRLIHLQAAAFSIGLTVVAGLTAGSLRAFAGLPPIELVWSVPVVAVGWMIGLGIASRRYA